MRLILAARISIYLVEAPELANFQDEPYTNILVELISKYKPEIVLCGATQHRPFFDFTRCH